MNQIFVCEECKYIFRAERNCKQCPDCGKYDIRIANANEQEEFEHRMDNDEY